MAKPDQRDAVAEATPVERALYCFSYAGVQNEQFKLINLDEVEITKSDLPQSVHANHAFEGGYKSTMATLLAPKFLGGKTLIKYCMDEFRDMKMALPDGMDMNRKLGSEVDVQAYWHSNVFAEEIAEQKLSAIVLVDYNNEALVEVNNFNAAEAH